MKRSGLALFMALAFIITSCSQASNIESVSQSEVKITKHPAAADYCRGKLKFLPSYKPDSQDFWQVDLRSYDLSSLNIKDRLNDLMYADFDSKTVWPENMPGSYNPQKIMDIGKNPGLGIEKLHSEGITGKGVGIAIIDKALLVDHTEYKDNLKMYEEIHCSDSRADLHGPAVASIAVGKTVGVAPEADLYYIAETHSEYKDGGFDSDFTWVAKSIDRILEVNKSLPKDKKIRVISISTGWRKEQKGYDEVTAAVKRAKNQGVFVVSASLADAYGYMFHGLGRDPLKDPDSPSSYVPELLLANDFYKDGEKFYSLMKEGLGGKSNDILLVPMDSRTTASPTGEDDYVFYRTGGWSWAIPYIAGLYALSCQVEPSITPDVFWNKALETGDTIKIQKDGRDYELKKIVNPEKLIKSVGLSH